MAVSNDSTDAVKKAEIMNALAQHEATISNLPCRPEVWVIDGGGSPQETVITFAYESQRRTGIPTICAFGRGWRNYKTGKKANQRQRIGENWTHIFEAVNRQWVLWHADYWRETAQRGWTGTPGAPGSASLPRGEHREFATQVCAEQLTGKDDVGGKTVWIWYTASGKHDFGDCMAMLYMGASFARGIGAGVQQAAKAAKKRRPRVAFV